MDVRILEKLLQNRYEARVGDALRRVGDGVDVAELGVGLVEGQIDSPRDDREERDEPLLRDQGEGSGS